MYQQLGGSADRHPARKDGTVSQKRVGFCVETSHGKLGDSDSGIFNSDSYFFGILIGKKDFAFSDLKNMKIENIADHPPDTQIINSDVILFAVGIIGSNFELLKKWHVPETK
ncbi:hypothetical protein M3Y98_00848500 [Aphelenchoides besseyi]|nr:hypothetical protein M3Y98_00848500 [Aphelenchoides besseyi]